MLNSSEGTPLPLNWDNNVLYDGIKDGAGAYVRQSALLSHKPLPKPSLSFFQNLLITLTDRLSTKSRSQVWFHTSFSKPIQSVPFLTITHFSQLPAGISALYMLPFSCWSLTHQSPLPLNTHRNRCAPSFAQLNWPSCQL